MQVLQSMLTANTSTNPVDTGIPGWKISLIFLSFLIVFILVTIIKKIYYSFRYQKRYYIIPKVSVKGISNIAMVISISVAVIILLTVLSANTASVIFRAWPGTRVTLEGILIKIGGLLFGPILGIFIGAMTDLLSVALTAGVFHYGYLIAAMAFGLIGGLIRIILTTSKRKDVIFAIYSSIATLIIGAGILLFLKFATGNEGFKIDLFGLNIALTTNQMMMIIGSFFVLSIAIVWLALGLKKILAKTYKNHKKKHKQDWFIIFTPVFVTVILTETIVNVMMLPSFDAELSSLKYSQWLSIRSILLIPMVVFNLFLIYPIFKIVVPLIKYDYEKDVVEDKSVPVYVD
ncbi:hypothetical protein OF376_01495 [Ureaplasma miroungigenitalium]|uniref:Aspartyl/glutamyl-tRNA amidotransferase subunit C n=1 Tax=Ureaplasma miroungigenitalium TaxID=1042321 RepID=A0ABT3BMG0_9BACT|nr:hypothetical protein [Ureaplasma miroungigenitalium]MCV3728440.1 hypothetical protein [Ureaplasma miroungigenitalium]MCV3734227.1 hypothetical protein [Ureaplasma miroungigenitalium]